MSISIEHVGRLIASLGLDSSEFNRGIKSAEENLHKLGTTLQTTGRMYSRYLTLPILAVGTAAFKMYKDFEFTMTKINTLVGVSKKQIESWGSDLEKISVETGLSLQELGDALYFITSAGMVGKETIEVLEMSAKAAATGLGETKEVADLLTSAIFAYGRENITAAEATDALVNAVRLGKAEADQFAQSMGQVFPMAETLGVTFQEVAGQVAALTRVGFSPEVASMLLKNVLRPFIAGSEAAEQQLEKMGVSMENFRKTIKDEGLLSALVQIRKLMEESGEEAMGKVIKDIRALTGALSLTGGNLAQNKAIMDAMTKSAGMMKTAFEGGADMLQRKWNQALSQGRTTLIELGKAMKPLIMDLLQYFIKRLQELTQWFKNLKQEQKENIIKYTAMVAAIGPALIIVGTLLRVLSGGIHIISSFTMAIGNLARAFLFLSKYMPVVLGFFGEFALVLGVSAGVFLAMDTLIHKLGSLEKGWLKSYLAIKKTREEAEKGLDFSGQRAGMPAGTQKLLELRQIQKEQFAAIKYVSDQGTWQLMDERQLNELLTNMETFRNLLQDIKVNQPEALLFSPEMMNSPIQKIKDAIKEIQELKLLLGKKSFGLIEGLEYEISELQKELKQAKTKEEIDAILLKIEELEFALAKLLKRTLTDFEKVRIMWSKWREEMNGLKAVANEIMSDLEKAVITDIDKALASGPESPIISKIITLNGLLDEGRRLASAYANGIIALGDSLGKLVTGQADAFSSFADSVISSIKSIISILWAETIAALMAKETLSKGLVGLLIASTVGMGVISALFAQAKNPPSMAEGGLVYGETLARVGEYSGARSNPEVIAPLNKLQSILGFGNGKVEFEIRGDVLVGMLQKVDKKVRLR